MQFNLPSASLLPNVRALPVAMLVIVGWTFLASGCALTKGPTNILSELSEARTRREITRLAGSDPFPSVADIGR